VTTTNANESIIAPVLLIDPITFLLHHPAVAYNFLYRYPRHANEWQLGTLRAATRTSRARSHGTFSRSRTSSFARTS
jgi:hypothetical protein